jgi:hypothetical protein
MIELLQAVVGLAPVLPLASDDSTLWLLAAGPAGGVATYWGIHRYYRNTDKSHAFERDTLIHPQPVAGGEEKVDHISRTRDSNIDGDNSSSFRRRVHRLP